MGTDSNYPKMTGLAISRQIKSIVDDWLDEAITDSEASQRIENILSTRENRLKIRKAGKYTPTFTNQMGVSRLEAFGRLYHR